MTSIGAPGSRMTLQGTSSRALGLRLTNRPASGNQLVADNYIFEGVFWTLIFWDYGFPAADNSYFKSLGLVLLDTPSF